MKKQLLIVAGVAVAGLALAHLAFSEPDGVTARVAKLHQEAIVIDTHIDTPQLFLDDDFDLGPRAEKGHIDLPRMQEGGLDAGFMSIWIDMRRFKGAAATKRALQLIDTVYEQVRKHPGKLALATTAAGIRRAHGEGKVALLMGMEGGTPIDDDLHLLRMFHRMGVRYMTLTHSFNNNWADSSSDEPKHGGLTDFGKEVVREMNRLGMMVDISHVSDEAFYDAIKVAKAPVIASHSSARALCDAARNLTDDQLRAVAKNGGVVHVNYHIGFLSQEYADAVEKLGDEMRARRRELREQFKDDDSQFLKVAEKMREEFGDRLPKVSWEKILDHIDHMVKVAGVNHIGLGSDFDGATMPDGMDDASLLPNLTQGLADRGYSDKDIRKILGGNTLRIMEKVERVAADLQ